MKQDVTLGISHPPIQIATHHNYVVDNPRASQPGARAVPLPQQTPSPKLKVTGRSSRR